MVEDTPIYSASEM